MHPSNKLGIPNIPMSPDPTRTEVRILGPVGFQTRRVQGETLSQKHRWRVTGDPGLLGDILLVFWQ